MPQKRQPFRRDKSRKVTLGDREFVTHGLHHHFWQDIYHYSMTASWLVFFAGIATIFLLTNIVFAGIYMLGDHPIASVAPGAFLGPFFFSIETLATVGYGDMHPQTIYGHIVSSIEIFTGMISLALITGVMFARFSKPRSRILFADHAVIGPFNGKQTLMIRTANARQNVIGEASAKLRLLRNETSTEGISMRRLYDLKLQREQQPIFLLGWNLMHVIDSTSPLFEHTADSLAQEQSGLILTIDGIDETTSQSMRARHIYGHDAIRWAHRFVDILSTDEDGVNHMDFDKFHDIIPLE